jgi:hypothetical protein
MSFEKHFNKTHHHNIFYFAKSLNLQSLLYPRAYYLHARNQEKDSMFICRPHDYHLSLNGANSIGRYPIF